jgi:hypothetical protein
LERFRAWLKYGRDIRMTVREVAGLLKQAGWNPVILHYQDMSGKRVTARVWRTGAKER